jgi:hypothetical protein
MASAASQTGSAAASAVSICSNCGQLAAHPSQPLGARSASCPNSARVRASNSTGAGLGEGGVQRGQPFGAHGRQKPAK